MTFISACIFPFYLNASARKNDCSANLFTSFFVFLIFVCLDKTEDLC